MGTPYSSVSILNYNLSPPPDDSSTGVNNVISWNGQILGKVGNPLQTAITAMNSELVTALDFSGRQVSTNDTATAADHMRTIECTATLTATLPDCGLMGAGYTVGYYNSGVGTVTVVLTTNTNTLGGVVNGTFTIQPKVAVIFKVNTSVNGYMEITDYAYNSLTYVLLSGTNTIAANNTFSGTNAFSVGPTAPTPGTNINTTQVPTTAWVNTYYSPIFSPTFTGVPAAPTPGTNISTTQIPTTAWVNAWYAPILSPTFTGTPAGPTAAVGTNTTQLATTANVYNSLVAAITSAGAVPAWISANPTPYVPLNCVVSPTDNQTYRCILGVTGSTTDPILDGTHWVQVGGGGINSQSYFIGQA